MTLLSSDAPESRSAAKELFFLASSFIGREDDEALWVNEEVEASAFHVYKSARAIIEEYPDTQWILNATGGNKPMSIGLHLLASHPQVKSVIYREVRTGWHNFQLSPSGEPLDQPIQPKHFLHSALVTNQAVLADLPLKSLILAQFSAADQINEIQDQPIVRANVELWAHHAVHNGMGWSKALRKLGGTESSDGLAFEQFVSACLQQAGVEQVACGVTAKSNAGDSLLETDVIAFHANRMIFVDIKLSNETGKTEHIRTIHATAQRYGGLSAKAVVLRPAWPVSSATSSFAQAMGVGLVNIANRADMICYLLAQLGLQPERYKHTPTARAIAVLRKATERQWSIGMNHRTSKPGTPKKKFSPGGHSAMVK